MQVVGLCVMSDHLTGKLPQTSFGLHARLYRFLHTIRIKTYNIILLNKNKFIIVNAISKVYNIILLNKYKFILVNAISKVYNIILLNKNKFIIVNAISKVYNIILLNKSVQYNTAEQKCTI